MCSQQQLNEKWKVFVGRDRLLLDFHCIHILPSTYMCRYMYEMCCISTLYLFVLIILIIFCECLKHDECITFGKFFFFLQRGQDVKFLFSHKYVFEYYKFVWLVFLHFILTLEIPWSKMRFNKFSFKYIRHRITHTVSLNFYTSFDSR